MDRRPHGRLCLYQGIEVAFVLILPFAFAKMLPPVQSNAFLWAGFYGLLTFLLVDNLGAILDRPSAVVKAAVHGGLGAFMYLEVLDASFSFDAVIGAFGLSQTLIHIHESITGLGCAVLIGVALLASIRWNRANGQ
jgi:hypothetical protein